MMFLALDAWKRLFGPKAAVLWAAAVLLLPAAVHAAVCTSTGGGTYENDSVGAAAGTATWDCGTPTDADSLVLAHAISFTDVDTDGTIEVVQAGITCSGTGTLTVSGKADIAAGEFDLDQCDSATLNGRFRQAQASSPALQTTPNRFPLGTYEPCLYDEACGSNTEQACWTYANTRYNALQPNGDNFLDNAIADWDEEASTPISDPDDWVCMWDFDEDDSYVPADMGFCYPLTNAEHDGTITGSSNEYGFCLDTRQGDQYGRCDDGGGAATAGDLILSRADENTMCKSDSDCTNTCIFTASHRLREIQKGTLAADLGAGQGCGYVIDVANGNGLSERSGLCAGTIVKLTAASSPIQDEGEFVGKFIRFEDGTSGTPRNLSYKILQTIDCSGSDAAPHVCNGLTDDVLVIGDPRGVVHSQSSGDDYWIDNGWQEGDDFFVMAPVVVRNTAATGGLSRVSLGVDGALDLFGVVFQSWGSNTAGTDPEDDNLAVLVGDGAGGTTITRWKHVIIRNDTALWNENSGRGFSPWGISGTFDHTNIHGMTSHCMIGEGTSTAASVIFDHQFYDGCNDGPTNWAAQAGALAGGYRRSHFRDTDPYGVSANLAAWVATGGVGVPSAGFSYENVLCDNCVISGGGGSDPVQGAWTGGRDLDANGTNDTGVAGFTVKDTVLWGVEARMGSVTTVENVLVRGVRPNKGSSSTFAGPVLGLADDIYPLRVSGLAAGGFRIDSGNGSAFTVSENSHVQRVFLFDIVHQDPESMFIVGNAGAKIENFAVVNMENNASGSCTVTSDNCRVFSEATSAENGVIYQDATVLWTGGRDTKINRVWQPRNTTGSPAPVYRRLLVAFHDFSGGVGAATFLSNTLVTQAAANGGEIGSLCYFANVDNETTSAVTEPAFLARGLGPNFVSLDRYDLATGSGAYSGCGFKNNLPPGLKRDSWATRKTKIPFYLFTASPSNAAKAGGSGGGRLLRAY